MVESLPQQSDFELFTEEEERVSFEEQTSDKFEVNSLPFPFLKLLITFKQFVILLHPNLSNLTFLYFIS